MESISEFNKCKLDICDHKFCYPCIVKWLKQKKDTKCPCCKKNIKTISYGFVLKETVDVKELVFGPKPKCGACNEDCNTDLNWRERDFVLCSICEDRTESPRKGLHHRCKQTIAGKKAGRWMKEVYIDLEDLEPYHWHCNDCEEKMKIDMNIECDLADSDQTNNQWDF